MKNLKNEFDIKKIIIGGVLLLVFLFSGVDATGLTTSIYSLFDSSKKDVVETSNGKEMTVHYIDVGQGDSIFIELPNNTTMLIDSGESWKGEDVENYIKEEGYSKIDYLVGTHPHTDHIGGLKHIIESFDIGKIYMPNASSNSKTFENLLKAISSKGLKIKNAKAGVNILDEENLDIDIIAPNSNSYSGLNDYSAVIKITYGEKEFLFMGDAEETSEEEILDKEFDISVDVVKVGHHGSETSSIQKFVDKVNASYAIISVGEENKYDHPYKGTIKRWKDSGALVYRTDKNGTVVVTTDGEKIDVKTLK